ncbi:MerR family transcriptional regulator [Paenibacillus radicis (ex Gao et al. 2016)]|uniref:Transcriptional regulator n=1 Tax=Paenibacillus radicis (ex Gao et al. 2016) TaxID=1737354 RepID=A0A917GWF2_9BACL|nr:MerR family transcriptional regulator [Paenibacillus radicis (ex Gao et al. 2016)]GGG59517.1 transcriptional regulator [Paenibacillus radicis (ex Gao et al. 2016)]
MRIKQFTEKYGISGDTARYYEDEGLLQPLRLENGYRDYDEDCEQAIKFIIVLKKLGFSLQEIKSMLQFEQNPISAQCDFTSQTMFSVKMDYIRQQVVFYQSALKALELVTSLMEKGQYKKNQQMLRHLFTEMYSSMSSEANS